MVDEDGSLGKGEREPPSYILWHYLTIPSFRYLRDLSNAAGSDRK